MCHISNFPQLKPTKLKSAFGCNVLKFTSSWNLRLEFGHYREGFKMAHPKRTGAFLNFKDVHIWSHDFSPILV